MEETATAGMSVLAALLVMVIVGGISGWLAALIVKGSGYGLVGNVVIGILGAVVAGWIFRLLGIGVTGLIGVILASVFGAVVLLLVIRAIKRA
jgi:uncharacterized membrane protein YeaQ/YmgE (transglycosylase-associated protein family)